MRRRLLLALLCAAGAAPAAPVAHADPPAPRVAILPFAAAEQTLSLYGKPVADAVAGHLRAAAALRVDALSLTGEVPSQVSLVIDGRIVSGGRGKVSLEARVRDIERGTSSATVATAARPVTDLDRLARELAGKLAHALDGALAEQVSRRAAEAAPAAPAAPVRLPATVVDPKAPPPAPAPDRRPTMAVFPAAGQVAGGVVPVAAVTAVGYQLADRLGYRPVLVAVASGPAAAQELIKAGAQAGIVLEVVGIHFDWHGVLAARGRLRVVVLGSDGRVRYDETVRTDTLVGSRGDRHAALVRFVATQAIDIAAPAIARALKAEP